MGRKSRIQSIQDLMSREPQRTILRILIFVDEPLEPKDFDLIMRGEDYDRRPMWSPHESWNRWSERVVNEYGEMYVHGRDQRKFLSDESGGDKIEIMHYDRGKTALHKHLNELHEKGVLDKADGEYCLSERFRQLSGRVSTIQRLMEHDEVLVRDHVAYYGMDRWDLDDEHLRRKMTRVDDMVDDAVWEILFLKLEISARNLRERGYDIATSTLSDNPLLDAFSKYLLLFCLEIGLDVYRYSEDERCLAGLRDLAKEVVDQLEMGDSYGNSSIRTYMRESLSQRGFDSWSHFFSEALNTLVEHKEDFRGLLQASEKKGVPPDIFRLSDCFFVVDFSVHPHSLIRDATGRHFISHLFERGHLFQRREKGELIESVMEGLPILLPGPEAEPVQLDDEAYERLMDIVLGYELRNIEMKAELDSRLMRLQEKLGVQVVEVEKTSQRYLWNYIRPRLSMITGLFPLLVPILATLDSAGREKVYGEMRSLISFFRTGGFHPKVEIEILREIWHFAFPKELTMEEFLIQVTNEIWFKISERVERRTTMED